MQFLSPYFFLLLLLLPVIVFLDYQSRKKGLYFRVTPLLEKIYGSGVWPHFYLPLFLKLAIVSLFICILANPVTNSVREEVSKDGIDLAIVFDISKSMLAEDIAPNRLEATKKVISEFIGHFTSDRIALVLFAGKPFLSTPLTFDYAALTDSVERMTTDSIKQDVPGLSGTAIGDGLLVAIDTLTHVICPPDSDSEGPCKGFDEKRKKVIILLTDGEANMGVDPRIAAKLAREKGVQIYALGIGNPEGTDLYVTDKFWEKQYFLDQKWVPLRATLDEPMLNDIADVTGGKYYNAKDPNALRAVFAELEKLTKTKATTTSIALQDPQYQWFLYGIIFLMPLWLYLSFGRFRGRE